MYKSIGLILLLTCLTSLILSETYNDISVKGGRICSNPPSSCVCNINKQLGLPFFTFYCSHEIVINFIQKTDDWLNVECINVTSLKLFPDITCSINSTGINIERCMINDTVNEITSKISKKLTKLNIVFSYGDEIPVFNQKLFEGLSELEILKITRSEKDLSRINIEENVYDHLTSLKELELWNFPILNGNFDRLENLQILKICSELKDIENVLGFGIFKNLKNLLKLELQFFGKLLLNPLIEPKLVEIPENLFQNLSKLEEIYLISINLKSLAKDNFADQIMLRTLDLQKNKLTNLNDEIFETNVNLTILSLSKNMLTSISRFLFKNLGKLKFLYLDNNKLKTIDNDSFRNLKNLQKIDLKFNKLSKGRLDNLFVGLRLLMIINLSHNELNEFLTTNNYYFDNLQLLDLSHNNLTKLNHAVWMMFSIPDHFTIDLSYNNITMFKFDDFIHLGEMYAGQIQNGPKIVLNLNYNPIICDCNALDIIGFLNTKTEPQSVYDVLQFNVNHLKCQAPTHLFEHPVKKLSSIDLICNIKEDCPEGCHCKQRPADKTLMFDCPSFKFQQLPTLPNYSHLNLTNIEINAIDNCIHSIHLTKIPDNVKLLDLRNNSLMDLADEVIARFESIDRLFLSQNPWKCNCKAVRFINFYHLFRSNIIDANEMICSDGRSFKTIEAKDFCIQRIEMVVIFLTVLSIYGLSTAFYVVNKKKIKMWLYAHNCCLWWVSEQEADKDKIYDAFFIFSHFDDNFVTDLILDLELKSFKCCVHHRDWPAGEIIVTLSLASIRTSRRIIVVLSPMFLQSNWATWEFRVALIHAFKEKRSRVLVIIYGDPSVIDDLDEDLKTYVRFNTYLDSEDAWFEKKLFYAMPHKAEQHKKDKKKKKNEKKTLTSSEVLNNEIQQIDIEMNNLSDSE